MTRRETRLVLYTNDAVILSLAGFPYHVSSLKVRSISTTSLGETDEKELYAVKGRYLSELTCKPPRTYMPLEEFVALLPRGFTPKIERLGCITGDLDHLTWTRTTLHPRYTLNSHSREVVERIDRLWTEAARIPVVSDLYDKPRQKRPSILMLETVNGSPEEARDPRRLWPIFDDIIHGGNDLARTPICNVVERFEARKSVWEYQPLDRDEAAPPVYPAEPEEAEAREVEL